MMDAGRVVLVVDDNEIDRDILNRSLRENGIGMAPDRILETDSGWRALELFAGEGPDLVLLDFNLPDLDGLELLDRFNAGREGFLPVIMLTGHGNEAVAVAALKKGAADYLVKDVRGDYLRRLPSVIERLDGQRRLLEEKTLAEKALRESEARYRAVVEDQAEYICRVNPEGRITFANQALGRYLRKPAKDLLGKKARNHVPPRYRAQIDKRIESLTLNDPIHLIRMEIPRPDGETVWQEWTIRALFSEGKKPFEYQCVGRDITEQIRLERELERRAVTDPLTGAYNRRHFFEAGLRDWSAGRRYQRPLSVLFLDVDHFKRINDTFGHAAGDEALKALVAVCGRTLRSSDVLARLGGEEFGVLLRETDAEAARIAAERLRLAIEEMPGAIPDGSARITVSIGLASLTDGDESFDALLKQADDALYRAKAGGRNRVAG